METVYQCLCWCYYQVTRADSVSIIIVLVSSSSQITSGDSVSILMLVLLSSHWRYQCINTYVGSIIKTLEMSLYQCSQILIRCLTSDLIKIEIIKKKKLFWSRCHNQITDISVSIMSLVK